MTENRLNLNLWTRCKVGGQSEETKLPGAVTGQHHIVLHREGTA